MESTASVGTGLPAPAPERGFGALDSDSFTKIILTELGNQDPLKPNDTGALLGQLSSIRSIESDTSLNKTLSSLVDRSEFTGAASLIGQRVATTDDPLTPRLVTNVSQNSDGVQVGLDDGSLVELKSVATVFGPDSAAGGAGS